MNQGWSRPSSSPHPHDQSSCGRHRCRHRELRLTVSMLVRCPRIDRLHRPRSSAHHQLHPPCVHGNDSQVVAPTRAQRTPSRCRAIPRVIAENASPKLAPVAWTTRGRVHSPKVKRPHGKRSTRKQNARLLPLALKTHQNCNSRVGEPICTKSVSRKWQRSEGLISHPYTGRHKHVCKGG